MESDFFFVVVVGVADREGGGDGGHHIMEFRTEHHVGIDVGLVMIVCYVGDLAILMVVVRHVMKAG